MLSSKFLGCKNPDHSNRHVNGKHLSDSEQTFGLLIRIQTEKEMLLNVVGRIRTCAG